MTEHIVATERVEPDERWLNWIPRGAAADPRAVRRRALTALIPIGLLTWLVVSLF